MRNESGFVMIRRDDLRELGADGSLLAVWLKLNEWANWATGRREHAGRVFELARGQLVTSSRSLEKALGFGRQVVRRCLASLQELGRIAVEARRGGTIVTIKGYGSSIQASDSGKRQTQPVTHPKTQPLRPVTLDPPGFADEIPPPSDDDKPTDEPTYKESTSKEEITKSYPSPSSRAREAGGGDEDEPIPEGSTSDEVDVIAYAQRRLGRIFSARELLSFLETWRTAPWLTGEALKKNVDWIASHPIARRDTKSVARVFYVEQAKRAYAPWDEELRRLLAYRLAEGVAAAAVVDELVATAPSFDAATLRAYLDGILAALDGPQREARLA